VPPDEELLPPADGELLLALLPVVPDPDALLLLFEGSVELPGIDAGCLEPGETLEPGGQSCDVDELLPDVLPDVPDVCAKAAGMTAVASPMAKRMARSRLIWCVLLPAFCGRLLLTVQERLQRAGRSVPSVARVPLLHRVRERARPRHSFSAFSARIRAQGESLASGRR
jgi:hypothetical protein